LRARSRAARPGARPGRLHRLSGRQDHHFRSAARTAQRKRRAHAGSATRDGNRPALGQAQFSYSRPRTPGRRAQMKMRTFVLALALAGIAGAGAYGAYRVGMDRGMKMSSSPSAAGASAGGATPQAGAIDPATGKKILYWHDPMVPGQKFDK